MQTGYVQSDARVRRLLADHQALEELARRSRMIEFDALGNPPERYLVRYACAGLIRDVSSTEPRLADSHKVAIYLHRDYPRRPPQIVWQTDIFHPNILSLRRGGAVCLGSWFPSQALADLVVRMGEMVQYKDYNTKDALDIEAAVWAERNRDRLPVDPRPLLE